MNKTNSIAIILLAFLISTAAFAASQGEFHTYDGPFDLKITQVRSISPERSAGFGKSLSVFAVDAHSPRMNYVLYCATIAPESGKTYISSEAFVSKNYSFLHLWPTSRENLPQYVDRGKEKTLYRVVTIGNITSGPHPDLACDIYKETPIQ